MALLGIEDILFCKKNNCNMTAEMLQQHSCTCKRPYPDNPMKSICCPSLIDKTTNQPFYKSPYYRKLTEEKPKEIIDVFEKSKENISKILKAYMELQGSMFK